MPTSHFDLAIALRWGDMDSFQHINNVQVARLFEEARVRALASWWGDHALPVSLVVARQEIEYLRPLAYSVDPVTISVWVSRIGSSSFDFAYSLFSPSGTSCALSTTTVVVVDPAAFTSLPLSGDVRAILEEHLDDPPSFRDRG